MKNLLKHISLIIILVVFPISLALISYLNKMESDADLLLEKQEASISLPIRLKIPKINVDAPIEYVGITPLGAMDVPKEPTSVAWLKLSVNPGEAGSSVISGHSGYKDKRSAAFDNLDELRKGDKIYVEDEKGGLHTFIVREFQTYDATADVPGVFVSDDGKSHLNLITCTGDWNEIGKTHFDRLVVFSDKE